MADLGLGQETQKINLKHLAVPENKEVLGGKKSTRSTCQSACDRGMSKGYSSQLKELTVAKAETMSTKIKQY